MTINRTLEAGEASVGAEQAPVSDGDAFADWRTDDPSAEVVSTAVAGQNPDDGEAPVIVGAAEAAMYMFVTAIEVLPEQGDQTFIKRAEVILTGLRKLEASLSAAARRSRATPSVVAALSQTRRLYNALMQRAAAAPGATLGLMIYTARRSGELSIQEAANSVGLRADVLEAIEAGKPTTEDETNKVQALIAALEV